MRMTVPRRRAGLVVISACLLALLLVTALATGCRTGSGATTSTAPVATSTSEAELSTSTSATVQLPASEQELAKTARAQNALSVLLQTSNAADNDPRFAIVYGLHARAQALGVTQLLQKGDAASLKTADAVMLDIYHVLNLARDVATGSVAENLKAARAIADTIGAPSDHLDEAKKELQQFIDATAGLIDQADAETGTTTTVTT